MCRCSWSTVEHFFGHEKSGADPKEEEEEKTESWDPREEDWHADWPIHSA